MTTFTVRLGEAIELSGGTSEVVNGATILRGSNIGLEHYPIFDEAHRDTLNGLIVDTYWNHEIGLETISSFRQALSVHMRLNMPAYNKQYEAALVKYDPLKTVDMETTGVSTAEQLASTKGESESGSSGTSKARQVASDFPQTMLAGNEDYATSAQDSNSNSENTASDKQTGSSESNTSGESTSRSTGYSMYPAQLVRLRQDLVLNVDRLVVESLQPLFFGLFQNNDEFSTGKGYYYGY